MCKVTRSKENFFDDDVSNNQNHSFFFEEGRFSSLSFFFFETFFSSLRRFLRSRFGQKTKKRYDFWPKPLPTFVLVASPSSSNTRTRRRRATTFAPPEARGRNDQATYRCIASVRRTRYGETRVVWRFAKQREKDDDDNKTTTTMTGKERQFYPSP